MANPFYIYVLNIHDLVWFGLVLRHISHCKFFNGNSFIYMYIN